MTQLTSQVENGKKCASELDEKRSECCKVKQQNADIERKLDETMKELESYKKVLESFIYTFNTFHPFLHHTIKHNLIPTTIF